MIVFSAPIPLENLLPTEQSPTEEVEVPGGIVSFVRQGDQRIVQRLIATDPAAYLNPAYQPGMKF